MSQTWVPCRGRYWRQGTQLQSLRFNRLKVRSNVARRMITLAMPGAVDQIAAPSQPSMPITATPLAAAAVDNS